MHEVLELAHHLKAAPERSTLTLRDFVATHSFPIVNAGTATFFFWDERPVDALYLIHWVFGLESRQAFEQLGETGAWYLPLDLPSAARVEYKFELHRRGERALIRDPLNPRRAYDPFGSNSVCPMPDYREPEWIRPDPDARRGRIALMPVKSKVYDQLREARVYLPAEYKPHKKYPLILCHDGGDYLKYASIQAVLDNLIHRHEVAPLLVAFTDGVDRNREYGANPSQADYLVKELLPAVEKRYGVTRDPRRRGLMGASFGAVSSLFTAWRHPGVFGQLLLQSGSFVFTDVGSHDRGPLFDPVVTFTNEFRNDPGRVRARIYQSCGTFESLIYYNRSLLPLMRRAGLNVRFQESQDGHNWIAWRDRLREGLTWLFPGHLWMTYE